MKIPMPTRHFPTLDTTTSLLAFENHNSFSHDKQTRIWKVQSEIRDETGKVTEDPLALRIRYAEIETICRSMKDQATVYRKKNTEVLTEAQRA